MNPRRGQPRRTFADEDLAELAASIKARGRRVPAGWSWRPLPGGVGSNLRGSGPVRPSPPSVRRRPALATSSSPANGDCAPPGSPVNGAHPGARATGRGGGRGRVAGRIAGIAENVAREDLNSIEEALRLRCPCRRVRAYARESRRSWSGAGQARRSGSNILRLLDLPDDVNRACSSPGSWSEGPWSGSPCAVRPRAAAQGSAPGRGAGAQRGVRPRNWDRVVVLVGIGTVLKDDPQLTTRIKKGRDPYRIILDSRLRIPEEAKVIGNSPSKAIIATTELADRDKIERLEKRGVRILILDSKQGKVDLKSCLPKLGEMEIMSLMVEGGSQINGSFLDEGLIDKIFLFFSPKLIGDKEALGIFGGSGKATLKEAISLNELRVRRIGEDILIEGYVG